MSAPSSPPVYGPRPFHLTHDDHRAIVLTISVLFLVYALMVIGVRVSQRRKNMGIEDWLALAATVFAVPHFIAIIVAVEDWGFGASYALLAPRDPAFIGRCVRVGDVFFLLSHFLAKCSVIWLCKRLFAIGQHTRHLICEVAIGVCATCFVGAVLAATVGCSSADTVRANNGTCSGLTTRWTIIAILDALLEVLILTLAAVVIFPLQMSAQRKRSAFTCFAIRAPIIALIGLQVKYVSEFTSASNVGIALTKPILFRQSILLYSLLAAAIPSLNQYLAKFDTKQATQFGFTPALYGSGARSYEMNSMTNKKSRTGEGKNWNRSGHDKADEVLGQSANDMSNLVPLRHGQYEAKIEAQKPRVHNDAISSHEADSIGRHNSEEQIIRKEMEYEVRYEE